MAAKRRAAAEELRRTLLHGGGACQYLSYAVVARLVLRIVGDDLQQRTIHGISSRVSSFLPADAPRHRVPVVSGLFAVLHRFGIPLIDDDVKHTRDHVLLGRSISCILPAVTVAGPVASFAEQAVPRGPQEEAAALVLAPVDNAERDRHSSLSKA